MRPAILIGVRNSEKCGFQAAPRAEEEIDDAGTVLGVGSASPLLLIRGTPLHQEARIGLFGDGIWEETCRALKQCGCVWLAAIRVARTRIAGDDAPRGSTAASRGE